MAITVQTLTSLLGTLSRLTPIALLAGLCVCHGQDAARMDAIVQSYVSDGKFMGSVLVARGNEVLMNKGYGSADVEHNIPNDASTKFRLGIAGRRARPGNGTA